MTAADPAVHLVRVRAFAARRPGSVLWDDDAKTLLDVGSGKALPLEPGRVTASDERTDAKTGQPYVVLLRDDGVQLVLAEVGIAWAPLFQNTGPLPGLPQVVCWADFGRIVSHLEHLLRAHPDTAPGREAADLVNLAIAVLDGARVVGFDVGAEERRLEADLTELERRVRGGG